MKSNSQSLHQTQGDSLFVDFNTLVLGRNDYNVLINHPEIRDYLKWRDCKNNGVTLKGDTPL